MKEFVCYRVKNLILPNIDIMKIKQREKEKKMFERQKQLTEMIQAIYDSCYNFMFTYLFWNI